MGSMDSWQWVIDHLHPTGESFFRKAGMAEREGREREERGPFGTWLVCWKGSIGRLLAIISTQTILQTRTGYLWRDMWWLLIADPLFHFHPSSIELFNTVQGSIDLLESESRVTNKSKIRLRSDLFLGCCSCQTLKGVWNTAFQYLFTHYVHTSSG